MKFIKAYKVLTEEFDGTFRSAIIAGTRVISYEVNKLAQPKPTENQYLFVFGSLKDARRFRNKRPTRRCIFEGIAIRPRQRVVNKLGHRVEATKYPRGTIFCDSYLPLRKLQGKDVG
jgi:hypothetical protein